MELLERFAQGDAEAFETLFREHQRAVYGWALCLVRDPGAAEDLTLEAFWRMHQAHARFDPRRSFGAWARRIVTNLALGHLRRAGRSRGMDFEPSVWAPDPGVRDEERTALRKAFAALPMKLKAVALLALVEEKPYAEIADALGISLEAVKSREFRAVRRLREALTEMGMEPCTNHSSRV